MTKRLAMFGIALTILLAALGSSVLVRSDDHYYGGSLQARQHGYEHGYRDGFYNGREDRDRRTKYDFHTDDYKRGDRGYEKYMGDKDDYKKGYREGYQGGYDDAFYSRAARFGQIYGRREPDRYDRDRDDDVYERRGWGYADVAYDTGYRDGLEDGQKDLDHRKSFDPDDHGNYRDSDHGYRDSFGPKDSYRREYRTGYLRGYEDGYGRWRR